MMKSLILTETEKARIINLHKTYGLVLNEAITPEILKQKYVDTGKVLMDTLEEIMNVSNNKINYAFWLTKMVAGNNILPEDVYKYKEYLKIFNQSKQNFPIKDINQINTDKELNKWLDIVFKIRERNVLKSVDNDDKFFNPKNYVSPSDIQKLEDVGIEYMGMVDGYQAFEIPKSLSEDKESWKVYKDILGKCQGRDQGEKIEICTIANFKYYNQYLSFGSLFVFYNLGDKKSPYQFNYESDSFMDKNDKPLF